MSERTILPNEIAPVRSAVSNAFAALRKKGFIARVNFSCCMSCATYELTDMARARKKYRAVYWHRQDDAHFREGFPLHIRYFYLSPEDDDNDTSAEERTVGEQVAAALRNQNLRIDWDGNPNRTIQIIGIQS